MSERIGRFTIGKPFILDRFTFWRWPLRPLSRFWCYRVIGGVRRLLRIDRALVVTGVDRERGIIVLEGK